MIYAFIALFFFWIFLFVQFTEKLKKEFPDKYEKLGSPAFGFFSLNQFKAQFLFMKFLFKREYVDLGNSSYNILGNLLLGIYLTLVFGLFYMAFYYS